MHLIFKSTGFSLMEKRDDGDILTARLIEHGERARGMVEFPLLETLISRVNFSS